MAAYFDPAEETHLALIPEVLRKVTDLDIIAEIAEAEVINKYTGPVPADFPLTVQTIPYGGAKIDDHRYVYLRGFTVDADDADVGADLKVALRRTIVRVFVRLARMWDKDDRWASEGNSKNNRTLRPTGDSRFPRGWDSLLTPFDTRPRVYTL